YGLAVGRLRASGEVAVERMIAWMRDSERKEYHSAIRRAMIDLGRTSLNPLLASTEMDQTELLTTVIGVLGEIGYDSAVPYLANLAQNHESAAVQDAARRALGQLGITDAASLNPSDQFYALAEKLYYNSASIIADERRPNAYVW